jgi:amidase
MVVVNVPSQPPSFAFRAGAQPVARVRPGERVRFQTADASYAGLTGSEIDAGRVNFQKVNALSGPVWVEGVGPGDALGFSVETIELESRAFAVYVSRWRNRMFGMPDSRVVQVPIERDRARLGDDCSIRVEPMIGCIGVAPAHGSVSSLSPSARTGGNMDLVEIRPGTTVWLPVEVDGGLLSLGDLHARMGRGEPLGSGLECGGTVTGRILQAREIAIHGPVLCDGSRVSFVGTRPDDWREAESTAVRASWKWLTDRCGVATDDAIVICAALLDVDTGGPAGNNVIASFAVADLEQAGVTIAVWPISVDERPESMTR